MNKRLVTGIAIAVAGGFAIVLGQALMSPRHAGQSIPPTASSADAEGAPMVDVRVPAELSADAQIGARGFDARCAECHGSNAAGQDGVAPPLVHKIYEPSHHGDVAFLLAARNGVRAHHWEFGDMPPVEGVTDAEVAYITLYVRELQRENGIN